MQKILIIGSNGYIGRLLTSALKNRYKLVLPSHKLSEIDVLKKNFSLIISNQILI